MLPLLSAVLFMGALLGVVALTTQLFLLWRHLRAPAPSPRAYAPISVLKPLCGVDDGLLDNLASFAAIDYPAFEVVLGVKDEADPAFAVARKAVERWPHCMRLVLQRGAPGLNPKVNQLITLERAARHALLVVSDSNVRVRPDYLKEIAAHFENPEVGCVTHPISGEDERRLGSLLDNMHLSTNIAPGIVSARFINLSIVVGKSMALRRADLERLGGFFAFKDYLAEDYVFGQKVVEALGKKVAVAHQTIVNVSQHKSLSDFLARYLRWGVVQRTAIRLHTFIGQGLMNPVPIVALAVLLHPAKPTLLLAAVVLVAKLLIDITSGELMRPGGFGARALLAIPLKDFLLFVAWLNAVFSRTVLWRGNRLRVESGSRLVALPALIAEADALDERAAA